MMLQPQPFTYQIELDEQPIGEQHDRATYGEPWSLKVKGTRLEYHNLGHTRVVRTHGNINEDESAQDGRECRGRIEHREGPYEIELENILQARFSLWSHSVHEYTAYRTEAIDKSSSRYRLEESNGCSEHCVHLCPVDIFPARCKRMIEVQEETQPEGRRMRSNSDDRMNICTDPVIAPMKENAT